MILKWLFRYLPGTSVLDSYLFFCSWNQILGLCLHPKLFVQYLVVLFTRPASVHVCVSVCVCRFPWCFSNSMWALRGGKVWWKEQSPRWIELYPLQCLESLEHGGSKGTGHPCGCPLQLAPAQCRLLCPPLGPWPLPTWCTAALPSFKQQGNVGQL